MSDARIEFAVSPCIKPPGSPRRSTRRRWPVRMGVAAALTGWAALTLAGCPAPDDGGGGDSPGYANITDKTNNNAQYVGSAACATCHSDFGTAHQGHGHAQSLSTGSGQPPLFSEQTADPRVPGPPAGFEWTDIAYIIGGYLRNAVFVDHQGNLLTTGLTGTPTQWLLDFRPTGAHAGFADFEPTAASATAFDYSCFQCHTTGARPQDVPRPEFQDGRPGLAGTWAEEGVQCEACHGPGSQHFTIADGLVQIRRERIFVDLDGSQSCAGCHGGGLDETTNVIEARDGFIEHYEQADELAASGYHARFACTVCHDPHYSTVYERGAAIRNQCRACHTDVTDAKHGGKVYVRASDGYTEPVTCESCHMPYASRSGGSAEAAVFGDVARVADVRTHIFRIDFAPVDYAAFFSDDGSQVRLDEAGRAAVTVDFVCLRCHNGNGLFSLTLERAAEIAEFMHQELP